jgi:hypothetical protein
MRGWAESVQRFTGNFRRLIKPRESDLGRNYVETTITFPGPNNRQATQQRLVPPLDFDMMPEIAVVEHDLFEKPVPPFPGHALEDLLGDRLACTAP